MVQSFNHFNDIRLLTWFIELSKEKKKSYFIKRVKNSWCNFSKFMIETFRDRRWNYCSLIRTQFSYYFRLKDSLASFMIARKLFIFTLPALSSVRCLWGECSYVNTYKRTDALNKLARSTVLLETSAAKSYEKNALCLDTVYI